MEVVLTVARVEGVLAIAHVGQPLPAPCKKDARDAFSIAVSGTRLVDFGEVDEEWGCLEFQPKRELPYSRASELCGACSSWEAPRIACGKASRDMTGFPNVLLRPSMLDLQGVTV